MIFLTTKIKYQTPNVKFQTDGNTGISQNRSKRILHGKSYKFEL